jgi:hypothetical protein
MARSSSASNGVDGFLDLATEDALLLAAMQPVAEPHETGHAAAELLDELPTQAGFRFFAAFHVPSREDPLPEVFPARVSKNPGHGIHAARSLTLSNDHNILSYLFFSIV